VIETLDFINWILYAGAGLLLMFVWRKFPLSSKIGKKWSFFRDLFECNLCLGVWFYWGLALLLKIRLIDTNIPLVGEFLLGTVTSFLVWVFVMGWNSRFTTIQIGGE